MNGLEALQITQKYIDITAAGQTDVEGATRIDMQGFHEAVFVTQLGTITGSGQVDVTVRHKATDAAGDKTTLTGQLIGSANSDKAIVLSIVNPVERYLDLIIERSVANSEVDNVLVILRRANDHPVAQPSAIADSAAAIAPATA